MLFVDTHEIEYPQKTRHKLTSFHSIWRSSEIGLSARSLSPFDTRLYLWRLLRLLPCVLVFWLVRLSSSDTLRQHALANLEPLAKPNTKNPQLAWLVLDYSLVSCGYPRKGFRCRLVLIGFRLAGLWLPVAM